MNTQIVLTPILVVDDNPTDLFFLQHRLQAAGIMNPLQHVEDGVQAIEILQRMSDGSWDPAERPWLMFLDLKMPRFDGFEVLKWIREHHMGDRLTVAVLSTSDEPEDLERAEQLGAHRFLVKYPRPVELAEVVAFALRRALDRLRAETVASGQT